MKILKTNWINIVGVFVITLMYVFINSFFFHSATFVQAIFGAALSVCLYGIIFWGLFLILLVVLDLVFFTKNKNNLRTKLLIEWFIISLPFIYWIVKYNQWIFLVGVLAFLITQLLRKKLIIKAVQ